MSEPHWDERLDPGLGSGRPRPPVGIRGLLGAVGPGIVVAATGVGAGDMVAAAKGGATYGVVILWAVVAGTLLKLVLAEGVARWQLATGTTLIEGWFRLLGRPVRIYFMAFLMLWTMTVAAALMVACGLAAHALIPAISYRSWAVVHGLLALMLVWFEGYPVIEKIMRWAVGLMFGAIVGTAALHMPRVGDVVAGLVVPRVPAGGTLLVAGVIGGVGGTLTLLSYGYWLREKGWSGRTWIGAARFDLLVGYGLTGLFGVAVIVLGHSVLLPRGVTVEGSGSVLQMAEMLGGGPACVFARWVFVIGFWAAVATSIVGVWQGIPYLFAHSWSLLRHRPAAASPAESGGGPGEPRPDSCDAVSTRGGAYRWYLVLMTFLPMTLLLVDRPVWLVVAYAALGSLFMPFLAATLLALNNRASLGPLRNGLLVNVLLVACLVLFAWLGIHELLSRMTG